MHWVVAEYVAQPAGKNGSVLVKLRWSFERRALLSIFSAVETERLSYFAG